MGRCPRMKSIATAACTYLAWQGMEHLIRVGRIPTCFSCTLVFVCVRTHNIHSSLGIYISSVSDKVGAQRRTTDLIRPDFQGCSFARTSAYQTGYAAER